MTYKLNSKSKLLLSNNNIGRALTTITRALQPMGNAVRFAQAGRSLFRNLTGNNRRKRNNRKFQIEVNNAEGGYKQVYNNGRIRTQTIEFYSSIKMSTMNTYQFATEELLQDPKFLDIKQMLNDSEEFNDLRKNALQYKVVQVAISFNYNRVPKSGEKFSKMILTPETDKVENNDNPKQNQNNMIWDMNRTGTKNYNFKLNNRNTERDHHSWLEGQSQFEGLIYVHISSQGPNLIEDNIDGVQLGEVKISVQVLYLKRDIKFPDNKIRVSNKAVLEKIVQKEKPKIEAELAKEKIEYNKKQIEKLEKANQDLKEYDIQDDVIREDVD